VPAFTYSSKRASDKALTFKDENGRWKKIVAQQALDIDALKVVLSKKW
jgi:hypothetical protein